MIRHVITPALAFVLCAGAGTARAQQRPLVTEDPETVGAGQILLEVGFDYSRDVVFPVSGLEGHLLRLPIAGISVGLSSIAEVQIDGGLYQRLSITDRVPAPLSNMLDIEGESTSDVEDLVVATKIRMLPEAPGQVALGLRFATRLPNAGNESGLGLDTTDFYASFLIGKTVQSVRVVGNVGLAILADPARGDHQNDVLTYGGSIARAIAAGVELVGEINGRANMREGEPFAGTENRALMQLGSRYTHGPARIDGAIFVGMTSRDPTFGFTVGVTYVFNAFRVP